LLASLADSGVVARPAPAGPSDAVAPAAHARILCHASSPFDSFRGVG
jgi:hypothetical protein